MVLLMRLNAPLAESLAELTQRKHLPRLCKVHVLGNTLLLRVLIPSRLLTLIRHHQRLPFHVRSLSLLVKHLEESNITATCADAHVSRTSESGDATDITVSSCVGLSKDMKGHVEITVNRTAKVETRSTSGAKADPTVVVQQSTTESSVKTVTLQIPKNGETTKVEATAGDTGSPKGATTPTAAAQKAAAANGNSAATPEQNTEEVGEEDTPSTNDGNSSWWWWPFQWCHLTCW